MEILNRYLVLGIILVLLAFPSVQAKAEEKLVLHEQEIKAGLLYNFLKYTEWPSAKMDQTPGLIKVCIFGSDPFSGYLKPMAGRSVNQRTITISYINVVKDTDKCNLLFINSEEKQNWPDISQFLSGKPVLTVSDFDGFSRSGGVIEFSLKNSHITAELNMQALNSAQLHVSERLIKLVSVIGSPSQKGGR